MVIENTPFFIPYPTFYGLSLILTIFSCSYFLSILQALNPDAKEELIFDTELNVLTTVVFARLPVPEANPYIPSIGPFTNPFTGFSTN